VLVGKKKNYSSHIKKGGDGIHKRGLRKIAREMSQNGLVRDEKQGQISVPSVSGMH
jgi:hypothetical protein